MAGPVGLPVIDTMIGFPHEGFDQYDFIRRQTKDRESKENFEFPVEYMFKDVPDEHTSDEDPVEVTIREMDRYNIAKGLVGVKGEQGARAIERFPDRFVAGLSVDPNEGMDAVREIVRA